MPTSPPSTAGYGSLDKPSTPPPPPPYRAWKRARVAALRIRTSASRLFAKKLTAPFRWPNFSMQAVLSPNCMPIGASCRDRHHSCGFWAKQFAGSVVPGNDGRRVRLDKDHCDYNPFLKTM